MKPKTQPKIFRWQCECGTAQTGCLRFISKPNHSPKVRCVTCKKYTLWSNLNILEQYPMVKFGGSAT